MKTGRKNKENIRNVRFLLPPGKIEFPVLTTEIACNFTIAKSSEECEQQTIFDSYDHRCLKKNFILLKNGRIYDLINLKDDSLQGSMVWEKKRELKFSKDISNPAISKKLSRILDDRAVVPLLALDIRTHTFSLRSKDKQPLTLTIREFALPDTKKPLPAILDLSSAKIGKNMLKTMVAAILSGVGQESSRTWKTLAAAALEAAGIKTVPGDAAPKISPGATIKSAAAAILKTELEILRYNEKGITADIDAECLHEFLVALRKIRVALDELNMVFPQDKVGVFLHKFDDLGTITNRLRDYDGFMPQK
ncbi:MAG: CHAD domain-containing protein, partial [Victivallaceae bacterium]